MDPVSYWKRLLDALAVGDYAEAADAADDLDQWRRRGGVRPGRIPSECWRMGALRDFARVLRAVTADADRAAELAERERNAAQARADRTAARLEKYTRPQ